MGSGSVSSLSADFPLQRDQGLVGNGAPLATFVEADNHAKRRRTLKGFTPIASSIKWWTEAPKRFTVHPIQNAPGPNF